MGLLLTAPNVNKLGLSFITYLIKPAWQLVHRDHTLAWLILAMFACLATTDVWAALPELMVTVLSAFKGIIYNREFVPSIPALKATFRMIFIKTALLAMLLASIAMDRWILSVTFASPATFSFWTLAISVKPTVKLVLLMRFAQSAQKATSYHQEIAILAVLTISFWTPPLAKTAQRFVVPAARTLQIVLLVTKDSICLMLSV